MLEIVFNEISAAEISKLDTLTQLDLLDDFKVDEHLLEQGDGDQFGSIEREGKVLHRFRSQDWRVYFEIGDNQVIVHRILHKNTFSDFLFRANLPLINEDEALAESKHFWALIDEGRQAKQI